jgi:hypothetical protein
VVPKRSADIIQFPLTSVSGPTGCASASPDATQAHCITTAITFCRILNLLFGDWKDGYDGIDHSAMTAIQEEVEGMDRIEIDYKLNSETDFNMTNLRATVRWD